MTLRPGAVMPIRPPYRAQLARAVLVAALCSTAAACGTGSHPASAPSNRARGAASTTSTTSSTTATATATSATATRSTASGTTTGTRTGHPDTDPARAVNDAHPRGTATCTLLPASRAATLLGAPAGAGTRDVRAGDRGRRELDGCSYGSSGLHLSYLVWALPAVAATSDVTAALPATAAGARPFTPGVGNPEAAAVLVTGPVAVAQVNAAHGARLVQVTVTAPTADRARSLATEAARGLLAG